MKALEDKEEDEEEEEVGREGCEPPEAAVEMAETPDMAKKTDEDEEQVSHHGRCWSCFK